MARREANRGRIEPVFDSPAGRGDDLRVEPGDRVVVSPARPEPRQKQRQRAEPVVERPARKAPPAKPARQASQRRGKPKPQKTRRRGGFIGFVRGVVYWGLVLGIWAGIALACIVGYYAVKLPSMESWAVPQRPPNARIVSVDGELVANRGVGGEAMRLDEMSPWIPQAVIAIEDRRFRYHVGVDPIGLARAVAVNAISGRTVQGGSTLTQQLAKNLFLEPERTLERKIQEALLALWLETKFSKDEILELYLNRVYFGSGAYGVDAAARRYFDKSARDLSLAEAAMLAGLLKAPSRLSPARDSKAANERAQVVLSAMRREGFITEREASLAMAMEPGKAKRYWSGSQHYVADMVMAQLPALIGEMRSDVIVQTTVDFTLQKEAEKAIKETLAAKGKKANATQAALVALDGTGAIRALVGGADYS
ncbi:MAG: penicillin-binding protein, partial [Nitratireductor sp.]|nr:penicillin-binding protein [Nitratireductor sp.]